MNKYWSEACSRCKGYPGYERCECTLRLRARRWWRRRIGRHKDDFPPLPTAQEMVEVDAMAIMDRAWEELNPSRSPRPGDGGPCPECGQDMRGKFYDDQSLVDAPGVTKRHTGRYWHMKNEHGVYEHYTLWP